MDLTHKKCVACEGGISPLTRAEAEELLKKVPGWELEEVPVAVEPKDRHLIITGRFKFKDFTEAFEFVKKIAKIVESEGHHPNIHILYNYVWMDLYTHAIDGLHENDFIVAAKINEL